MQSVQVETGNENEAALGVYEQFGLHPHRDGRLLLAGVLDEGHG